MSEKDLIPYIHICLFTAVGIIAAGAPILISILVRPRIKITSRSLQTYECGNTPFGQSWDFRHGIAFYLYALMFLVFEVDVLYLYPVATAFHLVSCVRGIVLFLVFVGLLALGLAYAWKKGVFLWSPEKKLY